MFKQGAFPFNIAMQIVKNFLILSKNDKIQALLNPSVVMNKTVKYSINIQ